MIALCIQVSHFTYPALFVRVDAENNLLLVRGAVPGPNGGFVTICETNKVG